MPAEDMTDWLAVPSLGDKLKSVDKHIERLLDESQQLGTPVQRLLGKGKRLRPALVIAAAASRGGKGGKTVIPAAAAVELLHMASLVHDDIIDNHTSRRGAPSIYKKEGLNQALLTGDWLAALALSQAASVSRTTARILAEVFAAMSRGQALELRANQSATWLDDTYIETSRQKSASLFRAATQIGGHCAGLDAADISALGLYGESFGLVFQIIDDLNDDSLSGKNRDLASHQAERYAATAAAALESFRGNPAGRGLAELPRLYLERSVKR